MEGVGEHEFDDGLGELAEGNGVEVAGLVAVLVLTSEPTPN
jgi:hypothetical protein